jgi:hypothetical protein
LRLRRLLAALIAWSLSALSVHATSAQVLDTLLAVVGSRTVAASDIALARALRAYGYVPSSAPMRRADVERYIDVLLILWEAKQIGISVEPVEIDRAWAAAVTQAGGEATVQRWLDAYAIDRDWARHVVEQDVQRAKFFQERFAAFVVPSDEEISRALGPGDHDASAREQARERLARATAERAQAEWLEGARGRAAIRILLSDGVAIPPPFPPP